MIASLEERTLALERNAASYREDIEEINDLYKEQNRNIGTLKEVHDDLSQKIKAYQAESQEIMDQIRREMDRRPVPVRDEDNVVMAGGRSAATGVGLGDSDIMMTESDGHLADCLVGAASDPPVGVESRE